MHSGSAGRRSLFIYGNNYYLSLFDCDFFVIF